MFKRACELGRKQTAFNRQQNLDNDDMISYDGDEDPECNSDKDRDNRVAKSPEKTPRKIVKKRSITFKAKKKGIILFY